jgi:hypothetical protein
MTLLNRDDWYDISHDLDWTLSYVEEQGAFPVEWSGTHALDFGSIYASIAPNYAAVIESQLAAVAHATN